MCLIPATKINHSLFKLPHYAWKNWNSFYCCWLLKWLSLWQNVMVLYFFFSKSYPCLLFLPSLYFRVWSSCEGENAPQHPSSFHCGAQHEGCQVCRLPGHCAFWTTGCHLSRSVSCTVAGNIKSEDISEDKLLASPNKNAGNSSCIVAITLVSFKWWNQICFVLAIIKISIIMSPRKGKHVI